MFKKIMYLLMILSLSACSFIHKPKIEQGNIITPEMVSKIHLGDQKAQIKEVLGNPVLINIFTPNREEYIYTFQKGSDPRIQKSLSLIFQSDRLIEMHPRWNKQD